MIPSRHTARVFDKAMVESVRKQAFMFNRVSVATERLTTGTLLKWIGIMRQRGFTDAAIRESFVSKRPARCRFFNVGLDTNEAETLVAIEMRLLDACLRELGPQWPTCDRGLKDPSHWEKGRLSG